MANIADSLRQLDIDAERLSKRTGIHRERVDALLMGGNPTASELRLIAKYVGLPANALVKLNFTQGAVDIRFRATTGPRKELRVAEARISEIERFLIKHDLLGDATSGPRLRATYSDRNSVEEAALSIRMLLCDDEELLDPICDLAVRLDRASVARTIVLQDLNVEGAASVAGDQNLIVVASRTFQPRMLFTCAHELSHIVLGHISPGNWLIDDSSIISFVDQREDERLCNALASAVLLPAAGIARFLNVVRSQIQLDPSAISSVDILYLSRYFGTSFLTAAMRLEYLGILPPGSGVSLETAIKNEYKTAELFAEKQGFPPRTPIDIPFFSPSIKKHLAAALSAGAVSIGRAAETFGFSTFEMAHALA